MRKRISHLIIPGIIALVFMLPATARADHVDGHTLNTRTTDVESEVMTPGQGIPG
ncbi:MAG: hypothetical protein QF787_12335 [Nitrospinota bacterium]|nr:hypothetical protein [Nitrospinota bacterium]